MLRISAALLALVLFAPAYAYLYYQYVVRPQTLARSGVLMLTPMDTRVSITTILPMATGTENAAFHYVTAMNSFTHRRVPYLKNRAMNPFVQEPPANFYELKEIALGARERDCDLYEKRGGQPRFVYIIQPEMKKWPFTLGSDPMEQRPFTVPLRALAQSALNWGKQREWKRQHGDAERIYQIVAQLGAHIRQKPGSLLDLELGIEIEMKALHYLETLYDQARNADKRARCIRYADSVAQLQREVRRKYAQLDNLEAALRILTEDSDRLWRIEAGLALVSARHYRRFNFLEQRNIASALEIAIHDSDLLVRQAMARIVALKDEEFRDPHTVRDEPE